MLCISIAQITKNRDYVILKLLRLQECRFSTAVRHGSEATKNMDIQKHSPSAMCVLVFQDGALGFVEAESQECWNREFGTMVFGADALRRLAPIFQGLTPSCLMLHNVGCNACMKKSTKMAQSGTTYLTVNLILEYDLLTTPLP